MHDTFALTETVRRAARRADRPLAGRRAPAAADADARVRRAASSSSSALFGRAGALLHEALACAPGWEAKFELLDEFFLARLDDALSPVPSVTRALGRLRASGGSVRVETLAAELGCSRRHLVAGFREQVGVPPKTARRASCASSARSG